MMKPIFEFVECDACFAKPGWPVLCKGCLANRDTIIRANNSLAVLVDSISKLQDILNNQEKLKEEKEARDRAVKLAILNL